MTNTMLPPAQNFFTENLQQMDFLLNCKKALRLLLFPFEFRKRGCYSSCTADNAADGECAIIPLESGEATASVRESLRRIAVEKVGRLLFYSTAVTVFRPLQFSVKTAVHV